MKLSLQCLVKISKALKCSIEGLARFNSSGGSKLLSILCEQSKFKLTAVVVVVVFFSSCIADNSYSFECISQSL